MNPAMPILKTYQNTLSAINDSESNPFTFNDSAHCKIIYVTSKLCLNKFGPVGPYLNANWVHSRQYLSDKMSYWCKNGLFPCYMDRIDFVLQMGLFLRIKPK